MTLHQNSASSYIDLSCNQWRIHRGGDGGDRPPLRSWNNFFTVVFLEK